jgi:transcriptional regulator with XRE-family HTH domain
MVSACEVRQGASLHLEARKPRMSGFGFHVPMSPTRLQSAADRRTTVLRRDLVEQIRRLRDDAGVTVREFAEAAGLSAAYVARILAGTERPTPEAYGRLAAVLGADLAIRLYPNTGPAIHDRHQGPILERLLEARHPRFTPYQEVSVHRPSRGWIDVAFHEPRERIIVAGEIQGSLDRLEQLVRWSTAKAESLPSWEGWARLAETPTISRMLVVRRTRATRQVVREFDHQLRVAYPAHPDDALAALTGTTPWPGGGAGVGGDRARAREAGPGPLKASSLTARWRGREREPWRRAAQRRPARTPARTQEADTTPAQRRIVAQEVSE